MRAALALLTALPVEQPEDPPGRAGLLAFPLVGLLVGAVWAGIGAGVVQWWGPLAAAAAVILVDVLVTGGRHLDGIADVGDVAGSRRRGSSEAPEVARNPHIGALGVAAVVAVLLVRFSLLATLLVIAEPVGLLGTHSAWLLVAVPVVGRTAMVAALGWSPRTRDSGASELAVTAGPAVQLAALTFAAAALLVVGAGLWRTLAALLAAAAVVAGLTASWRRRAGAGFGDHVGAAGVLAEVGVLAALVWSQ